MADSGGSEWRGEAQPGPIENLERQLAAFEAAAGAQDWAQFGETAGFTAWLAGAARVSPDSLGLNSIWQAALLSLIEGAPERFDILCLAGAMSAADAASFLEWLSRRGSGGAARRSQPSRRRARRLHELGLLRSVFGLSRLTPLGASLQRRIGEVTRGPCGGI